MGYGISINLLISDDRPREINNEMKDVRAVEKSRENFF